MTSSALPAPDQVPISAPPTQPANVRRWIKWDWKWLAGILLTIILSSVIYDACKNSFHTKPIVTQIRPEAFEVIEGSRVKLVAETYPKDNRPRKYNWSPPDQIEGEGQVVYLNTQTNERHIESYEIPVSLEAWDDYGNECPKINPVVIKVIPKRLSNHKPEFEEPIHTHAKEISAGEPVKLDALANDKDGDKLSYDWWVDSEDVRIEGNGARQVTLYIPPNITHTAFILLKVRLTVRDGYEDGNVSDDVVLTITPKRTKVKRPRGGNRTSTKLIITVAQPTAPQGGDPNATTAPVPAPNLQPSPATLQQQGSPSKTPQPETSRAKP